MMKKSLQYLLSIAGTLGLTISPAVAQLSALPPLQFCDATSPAPCPQYFVPRDGIPVPGLEIIPWNSPRAVTFLNNLGAAVPPGSPLNSAITDLGPETVTQAIQAGVDDPALVNSFGRLLLVLSEETPNPEALQQAETDFIAWLQANTARTETDLSLPPSLGSPSTSELTNFSRAVAEVLNRLPSEDVMAIYESPQAFQTFTDSLAPQTPIAQIELSQQSQDFIYQSIQHRVGLQNRIRQAIPTPLDAPSPSLDVSGLNITGLPTLGATLENTYPTENPSGVTDAVRAEVEAYQIAYAPMVSSRIDAPFVAPSLPFNAQEASVSLPEMNNPWSAFVSGNIAWGNTQNITTFDLNNYAILVGADYTFNPHFMLGGTVSYSTGSQRNNLSNAEADSVALSLYGSGQYGTGGYTTGFIGYGFDSFNSRRTIVIPGANREIVGATSGNQFNLGLETGWVFAEGGFLIQPSLGVRYISSRVNGYTETGDAILSTIIDGYDTNSTIANLGVDLAYPILTGDRYVMPFLGIGLNHRLGYSAPVVTARFVGGGPSFVVPVAEVDRTWFDLSVGVSAELSRYTVGQIIFRTDLGRFDSSIHNISINLRHDF